MKLNDFIFSNADKKLVGRKVFFYQSVFNKLFRSYTPSYLQYTSKIINPQNIEVLGSSSGNLKISLASSPSIYIQARSKILIHSSVLIGPRVSIISANHVKDNFLMFDETNDVSISIGKNVWIGANSVILPNVNIGDNCIIGAGSIVTKSIDNSTTVVGNPARVIGS